MKIKCLLQGFICLSALLVSSCTGSKNCSSVKATDQPTIVYLLFDLSGSAKNSRPHYIEEFSRVAGNLKPGDAVVADVISDNSLTTEKFAINRMLKPPPQLNNKNGSLHEQEETFKSLCKDSAENLEREREDIKKLGKDFLSNAGIASSKTRILDGIYASTRVFRSYPKHTRKILLVYSDGIEDSDLAVFDKTLPGDSLIAALKQKERLPDLGGATVFFIGATQSASVVKDGSTDYLAVRNFWFKYFKEANAELSEENYGSKSVTLNFDPPEKVERAAGDGGLMEKVKDFFGISN